MIIKDGCIRRQDSMMTIKQIKSNQINRLMYRIIFFSELIIQKK